MVDLALIGTVSTEGGPLLLADRSAFGGWTGTDGDDYDRLCRRFEIGEPDAIQLDDPRVQALAWFVPTGTTEVWRVGPNSIVLCRAWLEPTVHDGHEMASLPFSQTTRLGSLSILSGWFAVFWATATGAEVVSRSPKDGQRLDMAVGGDGLIVALDPGDYECWADEVAVSSGSARRCFVQLAQVTHISPSEPSGAATR